MSKPAIAIIGGGLAGVYAAHRLYSAGIEFDLFEARPRLGGRIHSTDAGLDLGPTWFWPDFQPRMQALVTELGLPIFEQHETGDALVERSPTQILRHRGYQSGNRSMRIAGGTDRLIQALASALPRDRIHLSTPVQGVQLSDAGVRILDRAYTSAWLAIPPRLMSQVSFTPALTERTAHLMAQVPTWMAAHAKYVARYDRTFWRDQGLSGDAFSAAGPLGEIHDASHGDTAALFGFFGIGALQRRGIDSAALKVLCRAQLARLFGADAGTPLEDEVVDWAAQPLTAAEADQIAVREHGRYDLTSVIEQPWQPRLRLIGSETARDQGGYMEGALSAVDAALEQLRARS